jgi:hypothetical protein
MAERRQSNSELRWRRLEQEEPRGDEDRGILELFEVEQASDEDAPLARDDDGDDER